MDTLKKIFPISFKRANSVADFIIGLIIYAVISIVAGLLIGFAGLLTGWIPVIGAIIGLLLGLIGSLVELYVVAGVVILILVFTKILK